MSDIADLRDQIAQAYNKLAIDDLVEENDQLLEQMQAPDFWADNEKAQDISKKQSALQKRIDLWAGLKNDATDLSELEALNDDSLSSDIKQAVCRSKC